MSTDFVELNRWFAPIRRDQELNPEYGAHWGARLWEKSHQFRPMNEACKNAKIVPAIGFHGLRHTWASLSVMNGMPLLVVAKNLGHTDTRMVEKHYGHLAPSYVADAVRAGAPRFGTVQNTNVVSMGGL
ncbi:tyrosine-type recombinase/integrase [Mesorhizobium sp. CO1-1-7]|uniref:tyrosine-type recombinase/integrase n=1 Tax=Mesorhizobium sp. CO1-1-7 TaxID=2876632 RepID=UPI001CD05B5F|nr:tyrosine-type recombinase/integrase [Mesorhizobium sp. CO1-1-7]MBZ9748312.1 tyrosine-type recombinase/integrase [Mesorhizobium sp. CO1-1-7]